MTWRFSGGTVVLGSLVAAVLLLGSCGDGGDADADRSVDSDRADPVNQPSGTFDVGGRELFISCQGEGSPTMILEVGEGRPRQDLDAIGRQYASQMTVCSYDRGNKGSSGPAPKPRTGPALVSDLHGLLAAAEVAGPYLLVGHSAGGLIVQAYAASYPEDVAGVVAINPVFRWSQWKSAAFPLLTPQERKLDVAFVNGENGESLHYRSIGEVIEEHGVPIGIPFEIVMSTVDQCPPDLPDLDYCVKTHPVWQEVLEDTARDWSGEITVVKASHDIYYDRPKAVTRAIDDVIAQSGD